MILLIIRNLGTSLIPFTGLIASEDLDEPDFSNAFVLNSLVVWFESDFKFEVESELNLFS